MRIGCREIWKSEKLHTFQTKESILCSQLNTSCWHNLLPQIILPVMKHRIRVYSPHNKRMLVLWEESLRLMFGTLICLQCLSQIVIFYLMIFAHPMITEPTFELIEYMLMCIYTAIKCFKFECRYLLSKGISQ